jgi:chorismate mutase-like protein
LTQDRLKELRVEIDAIDDRILELLNRRAKAAIEVGSIKKDRNLNVYVPEREVEILRRLTAVNEGPFPNDGLKAIYREIISASLSLEKPLSVARAPSTFPRSTSPACSTRSIGTRPTSGWCRSRTAARGSSATPSTCSSITTCSSAGRSSSRLRTTS